MTIFTKSAHDVFASVDASGNIRRVVNGEVQTWGREVEYLADLAFTSSLVYSTRAALYANLVPAANSPALVIGDPTAGYDGLYMKVGATTTGSWTRLGDVPGRQYIKATDAGAGTANAIVATTDIPLPAADRAAIISLNIYEANTATPVTVAFNGGSALTIKTNSGNNVSVGGLTAGATILGQVAGTTFTLLSDQASAAVLAAAEASETAAALSASNALASETAAASSESDANASAVAAAASAALALAAAAASGDVAFFDTYADAGAALGALSEGRVVHVFADEKNGGAEAYYRVESAALVLKVVVGLYNGKRAVNARAMGAKGDDSTNDAAAIVSALASGHALGVRCVYLPSGTYIVDGGGSAGLPLDYTNMELYGDGRGKTILRPPAGYGRNIISLAADVEDIYIHDLECYGRWPDVATGTIGIRLQSPCSRVTLERVYSHHNGGYGTGVGYGSEEARGEGLKYIDSEFAYNGGDGLDTHRAGHVEVVRCSSHHNVGDGFDARGADLIYVDSRAWENSGDGFGSGPISLNWPGNRLTMTNCYSWANGTGMTLRDAAETFPMWDAVTTGGSADAYTLTAAPTVASLALGAQAMVRFHTTNLTETPTINVDGLGAKTLIMEDRTYPRAGDVLTGHDYLLIYRPDEDKGGGAWCMCEPHEYTASITNFQAWGNTGDGLSIIVGRGNITLNACHLNRNKRFGLSMAQQDGTGYHDAHNLTVTVNGGSIFENESTAEVYNTTLDCNLILNAPDIRAQAGNMGVTWTSNGDLLIKGGRIVGGATGTQSRARTPVTTTGTSTAYVLTHTEAQGIRPQLNAKQRIGCIFDETNGANPTINVDGLGAKKLLNYGAAALSGAEFDTSTYYFFDYVPTADSGSGAWVRRRAPFVDIDTDISGQSGTGVNHGQYADARIDGSIACLNGIVILSNAGRVKIPASIDLSRVTGTRCTDSGTQTFKDYGEVLYGQATYDAASLADGEGVTTTVTVTGAVVGDFAECSMNVAMSNVSMTAWVSGSNTVSVRFQNESGGTVDLANAVLRVRVKRKPD